eukprot:824371-Prorocentrum_minimum.AAC.4
MANIPSDRLGDKERIDAFDLNVQVTLGTSQCTGGDAASKGLARLERRPAILHRNATEGWAAD